MLESVFFLFLAIALGLMVWSITKRDSALLGLGCVLLLGNGLLLLDSSPDAGIEQDNGFFVRYLGDNNFAIDFNTSFRNAGNDVTMNVLGNLFLFGGMAGVILSVGLVVEGERRKRRLR